MSKKKNSGAKRSKKGSAPPTQKGRTSSQQPPKWGILIAGLMAFFIVSIAIITMDKMGVVNPYVRTGVVMVLAIAAGLAARPLTLALHNRTGDDD
jgi:hypothetical protein